MTDSASSPTASAPPPSDSLQARARRVLPGGFGRSTFMVGAQPPYVLRGQGCRVWDEAGRELVDVNNNFTALVHGHAHPEIVEAARGALDRGASFGMPNVDELRHAEALADRIPHVDVVRYTNSGTEAVMTALRVARAHTGRDRCLVVRRAYHGTADVVLPAGGRDAERGVPRRVVDETILLDLNDLEGLRAAIDADPDGIAAVLVDLLPNRAGLIPADPAFVDAMVRLCQEHGILLVCDEIVSYRLRPDGLSTGYGIAPDLTVLGKLIGGGLPIGAVAGRREVMAQLDPAGAALEHGGTFSGNPVSMAAGLAAMRLLDAAATERLNRLGDAMRIGLQERIAPAGWEMRGRGSLLRPFPLAGSAPEQHRWLWWACYDRGVLINPNGLVALSTPMDDAVCAVVADALGDAVEAIADGWRPKII